MECDFKWDYLFNINIYVRQGKGKEKSSLSSEMKGASGLFLICFLFGLVWFSPRICFTNKWICSSLKTEVSAFH